MSAKEQIKIPATYMRGGTSKGVFFRLSDLPQSAQQPGDARDTLLLRVLGSPDPYGTHIDGLGGATSSTSKAVILNKSTQPDHDVDYLFGQVSIDKPFIDWSGNCGNLTAAVGAFAIRNQLLDINRIPTNGFATVRIWQVNIKKTIVVQVPVINGQVVELGDFMLDGVAFPAAEISVEFLDPVSSDVALFPTGNLVDELNVPGLGCINATLINAGIPTVFVNAEDVGYQGTELREAINGDAKALEKFETIRAHGAIKMGLFSNLDDAAVNQHTPKIAFVAAPMDYQSSSGKIVAKNEIDLCVRALSMGKLHHAMMGTAAVAIGAAAAIPGTLVNLATGKDAKASVCVGHPAGTLKVGAQAQIKEGCWTISKAIMSRSARRLMEGVVLVPA